MSNFDPTDNPLYRRFLAMSHQEQEEFVSAMAELFASLDFILTTASTVTAAPASTFGAAESTGAD